MTMWEDFPKHEIDMLLSDPLLLNPTIEELAEQICFIALEEGEFDNLDVLRRANWFASAWTPPSKGLTALLPGCYARNHRRMMGLAHDEIKKLTFSLLNGKYSDRLQSFD